MFAKLFTIVAPVVACIAVGIVWGRRGGRYDLEFVTSLITQVGAPALIFHTLAGLTIDPAALGQMAAATTTAMAICLAAGGLALKLAGQPLRAFLPVLTFPNSGNMGLPLSMLAFGQEGLTFAIAVFAVHTVAMFTVGVAIASGSMALKPLVRSPLIWSAPLGLAFPLLGLSPPSWVAATTDLLGGMTIPMMLITLGVSLSRLRVVAWRESLGLAFGRLGLGLASGWAAAMLFDLEPAARAVLILQVSMPTAVFNYLFAQRHQTRPEAVAGAVMASTALGFLSVPAILMLFL